MTVNESIFRNILRLFVWYPFRWLVALLPVRLGIPILRTMGDVHFFLSRGKKKLLLDNLLRLQGNKNLPNGSNNKIIREYFRNHYIDRLLIFVFPKFGKKEIDRFVELSGIEKLDGALKKGRGVILIHGHFGPVHLPLVVLARLGYRMKQIGLPSDEGLSWIGRNVAFRLRVKCEAKMPAEVIKADSFLRPAFKWLKNNGIIMITGDGSGTERRVGRHEDFIFCGYPARFPLGPSLLANKTGAEILPLFIVPGEKKTYKIIIENHFASQHSGDERARDITGQFVHRLEKYVLLYPGYMHFMDRFKEGEFN